VKHQTGTRWQQETQDRYRSLDVEAEVLSFVDDMASVLGGADAVICRAGALTVSELCAAGVGGILVPFPYAVDDHQTKNASYMVKGDAGLCVQQSDLSVEWLTERLVQWIRNPSALREMAVAARQLAQMNATEKVLEQVREAAEKALLTSGV
jgi:UDP-N-acetylglucosamine--N-acetylmuramyl-(pentapeptide) pyrophosphoryl-undecaprenol N-acetylglucosamine transferase